MTSINSRCCEHYTHNTKLIVGINV